MTPIDADISACPPDGPDQTLDRLQALLMSFVDVDTFLSDLAALATEMLPGSSTGITAHHEGSVQTVAASDKRALQLDETQYHHGTGPCLQALNSGRVVECPDVTTESRWPDYTAAAQQQGLRASLSVPMIAGGSTLAALNNYSFETQDAFGAHRRRQYEQFAVQAAVALRLAIRHRKDGMLLDQLEAAMDSRAVIDQALGMIMMQQRCTAVEAFELLRSQSQNSNRKLRDIATELINKVSGQPPVAGRAFDR